MSDFLFDPDPVQPPVSRLDALGRHLWGHRRIFPHLIDAADDALLEATGWSGDLAREFSEPEFGLTWAHYPEHLEPAVGPRYSLTELGFRWLHGGNFLIEPGWSEFKRQLPRYRWGVMVALFAAGCFDGGGDLRLPRVRRANLATRFGWEIVWPLVMKRQVGRDVADLVDSLLLIGAMGRNAERGVAVVRLLDDIKALCEQGLIRERQPHPPTLMNPQFWEMHPDHEPATRAIMRDSVLAADFSEDVQEFLLWLSTRTSSMRRRTFSGVPRPGAGLAELVALGRTQQIIAQLLRGHPDRFWATGSLVSIRNLKPHAPTPHVEGDSAGLLHRSARRTWHLPDGCLWVAGDHPTQPSVLIEYDPNTKNLQVEQHLSTAMMLSSLWTKPVWILVVTTGQSRATTIEKCDNLLGTLDMQAQKLQWPHADVRLRIVQYSNARAESAMTCPAVWERRIICY